MRGLAVFLLCATLCALPALAAEEDGLFGAEELEEAVPEEAREILGDADIGAALEPEGLLTRLWEGALDALGSAWREAAAGAVKLTALCLLISAVSALAGEAAREYLNMAGCLAVAAVAFGEAGEWISAGGRGRRRAARVLPRAAALPDRSGRRRRHGDRRRGALRGDESLHGHTHLAHANAAAAPGLRPAGRQDGGRGPGERGAELRGEAHKMALLRPDRGDL